MCDPVSILALAEAVAAAEEQLTAPSSRLTGATIMGAIVILVVCLAIAGVFNV